MVSISGEVFIRMDVYGVELEFSDEGELQWELRRNIIKECIYFFFVCFCIK